MIKIHKLSKIYQEKSAPAFYALKEINLEIKKGELVIITGESGSGKSTLLNILGSLIKPTTGSIKVEGVAINSLSDFHASLYRSQTVGIMGQSSYLFDDLSVSQNLLASLCRENLSKQSIDTKIQNALKIANISHKSQDKTINLSNGERQRVTLARALVNEPKLLLLDEPTASLDKDNTLLFIKQLQTLKNAGVTIILTTHDITLQNINFSDKVLEMKAGLLL